MEIPVIEEDRNASRQEEEAVVAEVEDAMPEAEILDDANLAAVQRASSSLQGQIFEKLGFEPPSQETQLEGLFEASISNIASEYASNEGGQELKRMKKITEQMRQSKNMNESSYPRYINA